tara:strand:+ start:123 stop:293 length:171 start_codon:yes stop_codon:yes gene_type:complete
MEKRNIPESIVALVGSKKTDEAARKAADMAGKLDRNNSWSQEPSHVFRAITWAVKS